MRNVKVDQNLTGDQYWPFMSVVDVKGEPSVTSIPENATQEQTEQVIQTWHKIAVLKFDPVVDAYFGFIIGDHAQFLNIPIETDEGKFGVHVGDSDIHFFVFAKDMKTHIKLELVEITDLDNQAYEKLPLY